MKIRTDFVTNSSSSSFLVINITKKDGTAIIKEYENRIFELKQATFYCDSVSELWETLSSSFVDDNRMEETIEIKRVDDIDYIKFEQSETMWGENIACAEEDYDNIEYDQENDMVVGTNTFFLIQEKGRFVLVKDIADTKCSDDSALEEHCSVDFNGKIIVVSGFEDQKEELIKKIESCGGTVRGSVSKKTNYLIWNPSYETGYTVKLKNAIRLAYEGIPIKIFECTNVSKLTFKEFQLPPVFETVDSEEFEKASPSSFSVPRGDVLVSYNGCDERVVVPDGIVMVAGGAFHGLSFVKTLELPDSISALPSGSLPRNVEHLIMPSYLKYINLNYSSFENLISITTRRCDNEIYAINNCLIDKNSDYYYCSGYHDYVSEKMAEREAIRINSTLIKGCINSIIPDDVSYICTSAFSKCNDLKTIRLPKELKIIGTQAFDKCEALEEIYVPDGTEVIESSAFCWCEALKSVYLPASVKIMGANAFSGCKMITLFVKENSYAEKYAKKSGLRYEYF